MLMKVMIAEGNAPCARMLRTVLKRQEHEVLLVRDGNEAEERLRQDESIQLLIANRDLPGLDAHELCRRVRTARRIPYLYILMLTSQPKLKYRLQGYEAGVDGFLTQPIQVSELIAHVESARRIIEMQQELLRRSEELEALKRELEVHNAHLTDLVDTDPLTGLKNRRLFQRFLDAEFRRAQRLNDSISLILIDIDHFKNFNDTFGHQAGDAILLKFASELRRSVRDRDLVARYGGEEFVVVLPGLLADQALCMAERLRTKLAEQEWPYRAITASFGLSTIDPSVETPTELFERADRALYSSKATGRDRVTHDRELGTGERIAQTGASHSPRTSQRLYPELESFWPVLPTDLSRAIQFRPIVNMDPSTRYARHSDH